MVRFCAWADKNAANRIYHDTEWGVPVHDDRQMFEHLMLECLQCGLSWDLILKKREVIRQCFAGFDFDRVASFGEADVNRILNTDGMIHSRPKVWAVVNNARRFQEVRKEFGSFCNYIWAFSGGKTILYRDHDKGVPASNSLSAKISRDLKKRGFQFVGPITVYSHLQACGIVNDHDRDCPCCQRINRLNQTVELEVNE